MTGNKIRAILLALAVALGVLVPLTVTHQADAGTTNCKRLHRYVNDKKSDGSLGSDTWYIKTTFRYDYCNNGKRRWVVPFGHVESYNREGFSMSCSQLTGWNTLRSVRFNPYYWDMSGRNFNPGATSVRCDTSTQNAKSVIYPVASRERLYFVDGQPPKARIVYKVDKASAGLFEIEGSMMAKLRQCSGWNTTPC